MKNIQLKNGDIVILRNGEKYHYLHSDDGFIAYGGTTKHVLLNNSGYLLADEYDGMDFSPEYKTPQSEQFDIMEVYRQGVIGLDNFDTALYVPIWRRVEDKNIAC